MTSRGSLVICEVDEEEPKTILEIGGVNRPPPPPVQQYPCAPVAHRPTLTHQVWSDDIQEVVPPPFTPYSDIQEHKIVRLTNSAWNTSHPAAIDKANSAQNLERGKYRL